MKAPVVALAVLAALAAVGPVRAEEPAKTRLSLRDRWKAGATMTRTLHSEEVQKVVIKMGEEVVPGQGKDETSVVDAVYVIRCDEANADGVLTKGVVSFTSFTRTVGEEKDVSLEGVVIDVVGGATPTWKHRPGARTPSPAAAEWLDKVYGPAAKWDAQIAAMEPTAPVEAGETWKPDVAKLLAALSSPLEIDEAKSSVDGKLEKVEGGVATVALKFELATKALPIPQGGSIVWTEGGKFSMEIRLVRRVDGSPADATFERKGGLKGVAPSGPVMVTVDFGGHATTKTAAGGTIPDAKPGGAVPETK